MRKANKPVLKNTYFVFKNGRRLTSAMFKNGFPSYEAARNVARQWLRKHTGQRMLAVAALSIKAVA